MNKQTIQIGKIVINLYVLALLGCIAYLLYALFLLPAPPAQSQIDTLRTGLIQTVSDNLDTRLTISPAPATASPSATTFGKAEPFSP